MMSISGLYCNPASVLRFWRHTAFEKGIREKQVVVHLSEQLNIAEHDYALALYAFGKLCDLPSSISSCLSDVVDGDFDAYSGWTNDVSKHFYALQPRSRVQELFDPIKGKEYEYLIRVCADKLQNASSVYKHTIDWQQLQTVRTHAHQLEELVRSIEVDSSVKGYLLEILEGFDRAIIDCYFGKTMPLLSCSYGSAITFRQFAEKNIVDKSQADELWRNFWDICQRAAAIISLSEKAGLLFDNLKNLIEK